MLNQDRGQLERAVRATLALWGGGRNPIVRVSPDGAPNEADLQIAEVLGVGEGIDFGVPKETSLPWPVRPAAPLDDARFWQPHPAVVEPEMTSPEIFLPSGEDLVNLIGAGKYGLVEELGIFRQAGYSVVENCDAINIARAQLAGRTAWNAALAHDHDTSVDGGLVGRSVAFLAVAADENDIELATFFWNVRALRIRNGWASHVSVLVTEAVARSQEFREAFDPAVRATSRSTPTTLMIGSDSVDLAEVAAALGAQLHDSTKFSEQWGSTPGHEGVLTYWANVDPRNYWLDRRTSGPAAVARVQLERPSVQASWKSPVPWVGEYILSGQVAAVVRSGAIDGPRVPAVAKLYHRDAEWQGRDLRIRTQNLPDYSMTFDLPTPHAVLEAALRHKGVDYRISDKGQQVRGLLADGAGATYFRRQSTYRVLRALTGKPGRDLAREIAKLRASGDVSDATVDRVAATASLGGRPFKTAGDLFSRVSDRVASMSELVEILDEGMRRKVIEVGVAVQCTLCSLIEFRRNDSMRDGVRCRGCGSPAALGSGSDGAPALKYRLSSLAHTLSLNGGLVPLAATAILEAERAFVEPGANLFQRDSPCGETDLLGWVGASIFVGEAKASAGGFATLDIDRELSRALAVGADTWLAVCPEKLGEEIIERLEASGTEHQVNVRILSGTDLLADA